MAYHMVIGHGPELRSLPFPKRNHEAPCRVWQYALSLFSLLAPQRPDAVSLSTAIGMFERPRWEWMSQRDSCHERDHDVNQLLIFAWNYTTYMFLLEVIQSVSFNQWNAALELLHVLFFCENQLFQWKLMIVSQESIKQPIKIDIWNENQLNFQWISIKQY